MTVKAPKWDLTDLYTGIKDKKIKSDLLTCHARADGLVAKYEGLINQLSAQELYEVMKEYEDIYEIISKISIHADLLTEANVDDDELSNHGQNIQEIYAEFRSKLMFVMLEIIELDDAKYIELISKDSDLKKYKPYIRTLRLYKPHTMSIELEKFNNDKKPVTSACGRLFDCYMASLRFPFRGEALSESEILNLLSDEDETKRKDAGLSLSKILDEHKLLFTIIYNTLAKDKQVDDKWGNFERPVSERNLSNDIDDDVVDNLVAAVGKRNKDLTHRYYKMKAKWLGKDKLNWWDRNAPLATNQKKYTWEEARDIVLNAFESFDPRMKDIAQMFFDNNWIDAETRKGKHAGAFSCGSVPSSHPYILMNFMGKARDVMTLAHELGHGVHQYLASHNGLFMSGTPLTIAETASVFAEMLTYEHLLSTIDDKEERRNFIAKKVENMLSTTTRQIALHNFETEFHDKRKKKELTHDEICDIWMKIQTDSLGSGVDIDETFRPMWSYIPHFINSPFYVYSYAFGDCLVNALWQKNKQMQSEGRGDIFVRNYNELLKAGGTKRYNEALRPFELYVDDEKFWHLGLDMISGMIDELENDTNGENK